MISERTQHIIMVVLALAAFIMSIVLVAKRAEPFAISRKPSKKTKQAIQKVMAHRGAVAQGADACQQATAKLCSQYTEPQKNAEGLYEVQQACGSQYQPLMHCPRVVPLGSTLLGGTNL
jgi:hypothetical protein